VGAATDAGVVIELEPFRETSHVLLMEAHAAAGNSAGARHVRAAQGEARGRARSVPRPETESAFLEILRANE
jgi:hypothetical protein